MKRTLDEKVQSLLGELRQRKVRMQQEVERATNMIAALELAGEAATPKAVPKVAKAKPNGNGFGGKGGHRVRAKNGEMTKAVYEAFAANDGRPMTTGVITKYVVAHKPPSLQRRKGIVNWSFRVRSTLARMQRDGLVQPLFIGSGSTPNTWEIKVPAGH